jgi:hypothetical protein
MLKILAATLAVTGAVLIAQPTAQAAPRVDGTAVTQDLSAQTTVRTKTTTRRHGNTRTRTVVRSRTYAAPSYYGYYGPTYYTRPYSRPSTITFGIGGWW